MTPLSLSCFQSFQATLAGREISLFRSLKARALLIYLAVEAERPHRRDVLAGLLWPDETEQRARRNLSQTLLELREAIADREANPPFLLITPQTLQFNQASSYKLDVAAFSAHLSAVERHTHPDLAGCQVCLERLQAAVELYQGRFLEKFFVPDSDLFEDWVLTRREELHRQALVALADLSGAYERRGEYRPAQAYAWRWTELEPWQEEAHQQVMRLLALSGQRSAALAQYERLGRALAEELGVEPAAETVALYKQIRAGELSRQAEGQRSGGEISPLLPRSPAPLLDWGEAPEVELFYGREAELAQLEQWLVAGHCRLVALLGMGGIGKTTLAARLVTLVADQFDYVIWRSLLNAPPLDDILRTWLQFLSNQQVAQLPHSLDERLALLFDHLRRRRCLLVLDNLEAVMQGRARAGQFRPGYEGYRQLLQRIGESRHQSCLLLTSRERPQGLARLAGDTSLVRMLYLAGLATDAGQAILQGRNLAGLPAATAALVERYSGHPLALKLVSQTIQDLFGGNIDAFLSEETLIFEDIQAVLDQQFARLSTLERTLLFWLAIEREPVSPQTLAENQIQAKSRAELVATLRALQRRSLLEEQGGQLTLQNVVMEYTTGRLVKRVCHELETLPSAVPERRPAGQATSSSPAIFGELVSSVLNRHPLLQAQAKEYIRQAQERLILKPIADRLVTRLGRAGLEARLKQWLDTWRAEALLAPGYAGGNILNLLLHLKSDLHGYDFSRLAVWQAYLRGTVLPEVNFAGADLTGSVFTDTFGLVKSVAFSPDGRLLAAGLENGQVRLWHVATGQPAGVMSGHTHEARSIAFSPDGAMLASGSFDQTVRLWALDTGECLHTLGGDTGWVWSIAFSPDSRTLASAHRDQTARLWAVQTGQLRQTLRGHADSVQAVAFSPAGTTVASGSEDGTIRLWEPQTGQLVQTLAGHTHWVETVAFSPDGQMLASGSEDRTICIWEVQTGQLSHRLLGHTKAIVSVAFSPDGATLASGSDDQTIRLWQSQTGQPLRTLVGHTSLVTTITFSPDGQTLASGSDDRTICLWDVGGGRLLTILHGYINPIYSVTFSPNGRWLAAGSEDGLIRFWDVRSGQLDQTLAGHRQAVLGLAFSPAGDLLASTDSEQRTHVWEMRTGQILSTLSGQYSSSTGALAFSPDGTTLATEHDNQLICLWQAQTGQSLAALPGHTDPIRALAFSPAGQLLASASEDQTIRLWQVKTGQLLARLEGHGQPARSIAFSPDGELLASASEDQTLRLWQVRTGQCLQVLTGHTDWVRSVTFSPDGALLASSGSDQTVRLWEASTGQLRQTLHGHSGVIRSVAFHPAGLLLASGSFDETIKLWDVQTGNCLHTFHPPGPYQDMNIAGATGLTPAQRAALKALGAVERGIDPKGLQDL